MKTALKRAQLLLLALMFCLIGAAGVLAMSPTHEAKQASAASGAAQINSASTPIEFVNNSSQQLDIFSLITDRASNRQYITGKWSDLSTVFDSTTTKLMERGAEKFVDEQKELSKNIDEKTE